MRNECMCVSPRAALRHVYHMSTSIPHHSSFITQSFHSACATVSTADIVIARRGTLVELLAPYCVP
ncbi:hypothetical protein BAUCODRAFT_506574 [Baudoinia panamericana UAMH 10762]|uniref:Uncharacterized protein n=1 Tax=Baudoinia panamericana (strain UAMH 10762) TaxID=717646 RepID=M2NAH7_BAUPA|nr:uncharacterized protein BAUCODRAFT_506574 [Baudoinia panamericana UAMH 10762]EMC95855.1 hypothetical protein BAUCODRAFT_506574 [Baudoinia panamericana UAMH 10762]